MQQALERAGIKSNLGWNYAMNALEMASLMRQIRGVGQVPYPKGLPGAEPAQPLSTSLESALPPKASSDP